MHRDLAGFNFAVSHVDQRLIQKLANLSFTEDAQNVVLVGGPGTGLVYEDELTAFSLGFF
jgi:DNA replication protein DnaC